VTGARLVPPQVGPPPSGERRKGDIEVCGTGSTPRYGLRRLVGVEVRAFCRFRQRNVVQRVVLAVAMTVSLCVYERRVEVGGCAACLLSPRPARMAGGVAATVLMLGAVGATHPVVATGLVVGVVLVFLPAAARAVRALPAKRALRRMRPPGRHIYLHSLASIAPGAGSKLLRSVAQEADDNEWSLVLDAENEHLAKFYERFGFIALGAPVSMPNGERFVRMWRPAARQARRL